MADLAHDASGLASSEASGPATSDKGKLRVFISYSRDDLKFADQLDAALNTCGFECLIDRHGISGGEDWKRRLGNLTSEADTVVFVLSASSARSDICAWEVEESARLNKRILPIICRALEGTSPPPRLRDLNYVFFYEEPKVSDSGFGTGLANLVAALNTDFDWLREHTRYLQRAIEWDTRGRPANRLLSGDDIAEAKAWAARRPKSAAEPTALHLEFIRASEEEADARLSEQRKQLEAVAAAQAERETALHEAEEALKQAADAQRRRTRIRNIALVVVSVLAVVALLLAGVAALFRQEAEDLLGRGSYIILKVFDQLDVETRKEALQLLEAGVNYGHVISLTNLGLLYQNTQDYAKAREWYEKAAAKNDANAMVYLGLLYQNGKGGPQDYAKAREWYEKAAAKNDPISAVYAMYDLGSLYQNGWGVPQDYAKAREWWEKAAAKIAREAMTTGRYAEALQLQEALAEKVETVETKRDGKPGEQTANALINVMWFALFAKEFTKALTVADRSHALFPDSVAVEPNRAHALMFMERREEAKALYLAHKGKPLSEQDNRLWERVIVGDFAEFRKAGLTHPMMADIEKELGVSR
jgi:TPR repeat protein